MKLPSVVEFQKRRKATWRAMRWWLVSALCCSIALVIVVFSSVDEAKLKIGIILTLGTLISLAAMAFTIQLKYRCPSCGRIPVRAVKGWANDLGHEPQDVMWNPEACPNCRARLR